MRLAILFELTLVTILCINYFPTIHGQSGLYTQKEIQAIQKFRRIVSNHLTQDFMKRDGYLLRFLRSYNFDFDKAARRLEYSVTWRKEKKIDGILDEDLRAHAKHLPFYVGGVDKKGYPVVCFPTGKWDQRKYILAGKRDILLRRTHQALEQSFQQIWKVANKTGTDIDQYYMIVDLDGFHARQNLCLGCIPLSVEMTAAFDAISPVFVKKFAVINAPRASVPVLNLLTSTFPFPPVSLMKTYDSDSNIWKKELLKDIPADQLLKKYGGTREE